MSIDADGVDSTHLSPDDAFAALGDDTRMDILQVLGEADEPLAFSELRDRVGMRDSGQFNYHLSKLLGHFVQKTDETYELRQAGRRVVEAVFSGAVTRNPVMEPAEIDDPCPRCGATTLVAYYRERLEHYCTDCPGHYGMQHAKSEYGTAGTGSEDDATYGYLGSVALPPAGLQDRTPAEMFAAATTWGNLEVVSVSRGVCPRCSAPLSESLSICESHDATDGLCGECGNHHEIHVMRHCRNCFYEQGGAFVLALLGNLDLMEFLIDHGINPVAPSTAAAYDAAVMDYDEELSSVDPFRARFTFTIDGDSLTLTVDDDLNVIEETP